MRKFNRPAAQRRALMNNLARSVILHESVTTTEAKAKEVRSTIERLITYGKRGTLASRRLIISQVGEKAASKILEELADRYSQRAGGYVRVTKIRPRLSDGARMANIEMVK